MVMFLLCWCFHEDSIKTDVAAAGKQFVEIVATAAFEVLVAQCETFDQVFTVFCKDVADVAGNHRLVALEQVAHVAEGKLHGFVLQADFEAGLAVGGRGGS
ncbi:MAG: hypothetical protein WAR97_03485 [Thiothrix eikelboomii]